MAESAVSDLALRHTLGIVRNLVGQGFSLSQAMVRFPEVFNDAIVTVVRYGELYGELDMTLLRYADRPEESAPQAGPAEEAAPSKETQINAVVNEAIDNLLINPHNCSKAGSINCAGIPPSQSRVFALCHVLQHDFASVRQVATNVRV